MLQPKPFLPKQAEERFREGLKRDEATINAAYTKADKRVVMAQNHYVSRIEDAQWGRYQRSQLHTDEPMTYLEWLVKARTLDATYSLWGSEQVWLHFAGIVAEASNPMFVRRGAESLPRNWWVPLFSIRVNRRAAGENFTVKVQLKRYSRKAFNSLEAVPTLEYEAMPRA